MLVELSVDQINTLRSLVRAKLARLAKDGQRQAARGNPHPHVNDSIKKRVGALHLIQLALNDSITSESA